LHRNLGLPSYGEFAELLKEEVDTSKFVQHAKPVDLLNTGKLSQLQAGNDADWFRWSAWLSDPESYASVTPTRVGTCRISKQHLQELIDNGFAEEMPAGAPIRGGAHVFHVTEYVKQRFRVITHSFDANQQRFPHLDLPFLHEVRKTAYDGPFTVCLDMKSWFYQFPLTPDVRNHFVFSHEGSLYRWVRLAMGHRISCHIAQAALIRLTHRASTLAASTVRFIDNVKFSGEFQQVMDAVFAFVEDCIAVGATINEIDVKEWQLRSPDENRRIVAALISPRATFLGVDVDHTAKTTGIAAKTKTKITKVWAKRGAWTLHDFNSFVSLLCFCMYATGQPLHGHYDVLHAHRVVAHFGGVLSNPRDQKLFWQARFDLLPLLEPALQAWTDFALGLGAVPVHSPTTSLFQHVVVVDGSGDGYGILHVDIASKAEHSYCGTWPRRIERSTTSEPLAVRQICKHINLPPNTACLLVLDHTPAVAAVNRGHGKSRDNNEMVHRLALAFPRVAFKAIHIPGWLMPADPISRGKQLQEGGLRVRVLRKLTQSVETGETGLNFFSRRPICENRDLNRLDYNMIHSRETQLADAAAWLGLATYDALRMSAVDS